jgi:hypothetical protein
MNTMYYSTSLSSEEFMGNFSNEVTPHSEFRLISYLSPGGVVVRGISPPEVCDTPFFGIIERDRFSIVEHTHKNFVSPYQPILQGRIEDNQIVIQANLHPQAYPLLWLYTVFGVLLIGLGLMIAQEDSFIFTLTSIFGFLLIVFPRYRTQHHFNSCLQSAIESWEGLPLQLHKREKQ